MLMNGSNIADEIDREYKMKKAYEKKKKSKKKDDEFLEKMVEEFVEDMRKEKEEQNSIKQGDDRNGNETCRTYWGETTII